MFPSSVAAAPHHHTSFQPCSSSSSSSSSSDPFRRKPLSSFFVLRPPPPKPRRHGTLRASASLLRAPRPRRNALREKLLSKNDPQVLQPPEAPENPDRSGPDRPDRVEIPEIRTGSTTSDSALRSKLDNWVEQYREDNALWGVGTGPIFLVSRDPDGNVVKVSVDEQEIVRRNMIGGEERGILAKMERAKEIAEEIGVSGTHVIPENSSVVRFAEEGREVEVSPVDLIREVVLRGKMSRKFPLSLAALALCGYVVFRAVWWLWSAGEAEELTSLEKEMLRRKLKARRRSGLVVEGNVEVVQDDDDDAVSPVGELKRPELDMEKLQKDIAGAKVVREVSTKASLPGRVPGYGDGFEAKVKEIREMAKRARESERQVARGGTKGMQDNIQVENSDLQPVTLSSSMEVPKDVEERKESTVGVAETFTENGSDASEKERITMDAPSSREEARDSVVCDLSLSTKNSAAATEPKIIRSVKEARDYLARKNKRIEEGSFSPWHLVSGGKQVGPAPHGPADSLCGSSAEESENIKRVNGAVVKQNFDLIENMGFKNMDSESKEERPKETNSGVILPNTLEESTKSGNPSCVSHPDITDMECTEFQVLSSVAESNESQNMDERISSKKSSTSVYGSSSRDAQSSTLDVNSELPENRKSDEMIQLEYNLPSTVDSATYMAPEKYDIGSSSSHFPPDSDGILEKSAKMSSLKVENGDGNLLENRHNRASIEGTGHLPDSQNHLSESKQVGKNNWIKQNFHEFEPIVKKIREGFRENYMMAKQKAQEHDMTNVGLQELDLEDDEMEWVKDEKLKEIFFKVRENELAGKDPFYSMSADYKETFFKALEKKAEKFNKKLSALHEWLHSRIENIDYGADGISLYDPPEKVFPRWKGPAFDKYPAFLKNSERKQQDSSASNEEKICASNEDREKVSNSSGSALSSVSVDVNSKRPQNRANSAPRTIIECSDGSSRAGKKGGKEQWEHTKKWSRGFLEIYNAETDPEVKSAMRDMGKDLDRWITEKEVEEVGKLMSGLPEKQRKYIEKKVDKIKREMERYGPQAVVTKYREYSEEKEEDYLWWLDLKLVLCIELYTIENGSQKVGFYSLEMAPDLELDPKQLHVIAFEDPGDSKNFCYIMQTHLEMLGLGRAFVVPRPPKDAFREAKANGFHVTVIRKGELKLNIDQTLEEVEEEIVEIGSRIYHDRIIRERSVDIGALLTGVMASESSKKW